MPAKGVKPNLKRCSWVSKDDELYLHYHDTEWGVPEYDSDQLFEKLLLEGAQAGLSWRTILHKRAGYQKLFAGFNAEKMARFTDKKLEKLLLDERIVRNRLKVYGFRKNAKAYLALKEQGVDFSEQLWSFVGGEPKINKFRSMKSVPTTSPSSIAMSKYLKKSGFTFVGPTIVYAFMQACGLVNDHFTSCFRYDEVSSEKKISKQEKLC